MWNYVKLHSDNSPMAEILSQCSNKSNLRLVIYNLSENHVECATVSPDEVRQFSLGEVGRTISYDARNGAHAILAFDMGSKEVYLIDSTPELQIASAVLLCVVTELLNGCVQPRQCECGRPEVRREALRCEARPSIERIAESNFREMEKCSCDVAKRDERGRFVRRVETPTDEPWKNPPTFEDANMVMNRRFRLGRH